MTKEEWTSRRLKCYLDLHNTALFRKGTGQSYTKEDILDGKIAIGYQKELAALKAKQRKKTRRHE